ncbi:MAG: ABC transporter permease, partial [Candidatus Hodarchaeota archaeon]
EAMMIEPTESLEIEELVVFTTQLGNFTFTWLLGLGTSIVLLLLASLWQVYKFVQLEMEVKRERENSFQAFISTHALDIASLSVGVLVLALIVDVDTMAQISISLYYGLFLICLLITWFGIGHLFARSVSRLSAFVSRRLMKILGSQILLISKNFERQRENTFIIAMLLIIIFSISLFAVIFINSADINAMLISNYETGSDFKIYTNSQNVSFSQTLESDPGIMSCMPIQKSNAWLDFRSKVQIYGVNASVYPHISSWDPTSFLSGTVEENFQRLANTTHGIILNDLLANRLKKDIGSKITLKVWVYGGHNQLDFTVVGIAYSSPGLGVLKGLGDSQSFLEDYGGVIINGYEMFGVEYDNITTADLFLARAPDSHDMITKRETQNRLLGYSQIRQIILSNTPPEDNLLSLVGMNEILLLNLIGSLIILVVLIIFFFGTTVYERKTEFAIMRASGASIKAIKSLIFWEEVILLAVTVVEGYGLGVLFAWIFTYISFPALYYPPPLPYLFEIPYGIILGLLVITILFLVIGSTLSSKQVAGQKIVLILKNL